MRKHTPEPWKPAPRDRDYATQDIVAEDGGLVAICWVNVFHRNRIGRTDDEQRANRRRIVACVNACAGMATVDLEWIAATGTHNPHDGTLYGVDLVAIREFIVRARERGVKPEDALRAEVPS